MSLILLLTEQFHQSWNHWHHCGLELANDTGMFKLTIVYALHMYVSGNPVKWQTWCETRSPGISQVLGKLSVLLNVRLKSDYHMMEGSLLVPKCDVGDGTDVPWPPCAFREGLAGTSPCLQGLPQQWRPLVHDQGLPGQVTCRDWQSGV